MVRGVIKLVDKSNKPIKLQWVLSVLGWNFILKW